MEEDFPAPLINHLKWLNETGFKSIDVSLEVLWIWQFIVEHANEQ